MPMPSRRYGQPEAEKIRTAARVLLHSLTSFEFFDALVGPVQAPEEVARTITGLMSSLLRLSDQ